MHCLIYTFIAIHFQYNNVTKTKAKNIRRFCKNTLKNWCVMVLQKKLNTKHFYVKDSVSQTIIETKVILFVIYPFLKQCLLNYRLWTSGNEIKILSLTISNRYRTLPKILMYSNKVLLQAGENTVPSILLDGQTDQ